MKMTTVEALGEVDHIDLFQFLTHDVERGIRSPLCHMNFGSNSWSVSAAAENRALHDVGFAIGQLR
jgi:hypothetical protein